MSSALRPCHAVVPAAGIGSRMGGEIPKQYLRINGLTLLEHSLQALLDCPGIESIVLALHPLDERAGELDLLRHPRIICVSGGEERADSVLSGLLALAGSVEELDWVLVHDAARPCVTAADVEKLIAVVRAGDCGGLLAEPVVDTVKQADDRGRVVKTLDRSTLWRAQTPQMFRVDELRSALVRAADRGETITDEASAMELAGYPVQLVTGPASNLKVTVAEDLKLAAWYLARQSGEER